MRGCPSHHNTSGASKNPDWRCLCHYRWYWPCPLGSGRCPPCLSPSGLLSFPSLLCDFYFCKHFFGCFWTIFLVFIEFVTILFCFRFVFFWPGAVWGLSSITGGQTCSWSWRRWSLLTIGPAGKSLLCFRSKSLSSLLSRGGEASGSTSRRFCGCKVKPPQWLVKIGRQMLEACAHFMFLLHFPH